MFSGEIVTDGRRDLSEPAVDIPRPTAGPALESWKD